MDEELPDPPERPTAETFPPLAFEKYRKFSEADFERMLQGKMLLPNLEPIAPEKIAALLYRCIGAGPVKGGYALTDPHKERGNAYAKFVFNTSQWGNLDGSGFALFSDLDWISGYSFAICRHEFEPDRGHDPRRGHHFGHCKHCGYDLSVDSSD